MRDFLKIAKKLIKGKKSKRKIKRAKRIVMKLNSKRLQSVLSPVNLPGSKMKRKFQRRMRGISNSSKIYS